MIRKTLGVLCLVGLLGTAPLAARAAEAIAVPKQDWSFNGIFGQFDRAQLQRGFQIYRENCAACHGLKYVAFRNLMDLGYTAAEVKLIAREYEVVDGPDEDGEMFTRAALASDRIPSPHPNDNAARAANGGALPPDMSLLAKARAGGPDYIYALLTGYVEPPADFEMSEGMNYNAFYPGHQIAMAQPLWGDDVEFADGTEATIEQSARDVSAFLMWAADPRMEERKSTGVSVILFLIVMTGLFYASMRKIWADVQK